jgi:hypothetical protein
MYFWTVIEAFDRYARPAASGMRRVRYPVRMRAVRLLLA